MRGSLVVAVALVTLSGAAWAGTIPNPLLAVNTHDHTLITRGGSLRVHVRDPEALELGVWRILEILGYWQFLPTANWEIVPVAAAFNANVGILESRPLALVRKTPGVLQGFSTAWADRAPQVRSHGWRPGGYRP